MSKKDNEDDVLTQDSQAYQKGKDLINNLNRQIKEYLDFKEEIKKYVMWDRAD